MSSYITMVHFCYDRMSNVSFFQTNYLYKPLLFQGYRIFYTKAPDEKSSSSGWKKLEYETRNLTFNTLKSGRDLELVPNSRYIARIAQMRSDDKKRIDEIVEFDTVNEGNISVGVLNENLS